MDPEHDGTAHPGEPEHWDADRQAALVPSRPDIPPAPASSLPSLSPSEIAAARAYVEASRAASTQRAYATDWRQFSLWCRDRGATALPASPPLVAVYLSFLAGRGRAPPSIARALAAIAYAHKRAGHVPPHRGAEGTIITDAIAGIRRSWSAQPGRKDAADADIVMQLLWSIEGCGLPALRDRALIALGMALAARRSELVALDVADLAWEPKGLRVTIRRSKTDQESQGVVVAVLEGRRLTPLAHLRSWLETAGITEGPIFRPVWKGGRLRDTRLSDHAVARIIQARAATAGLDAARYAGHSLRAGFVTEAARNGADIWKIQQVSRHKSLQVLSNYVRDARLFDDHAGDPFL